MNKEKEYEDKWMSIEEASVYLGIDKAAIRNWIDKDTGIPIYKIGHTWKCKRFELDSWVKSVNSAIKNEQKLNQVSIDSDVLEFLKALYFGAFTNPYKSASQRAYRDMNRTIRFGDLEENLRGNIRNIIDDLLEYEIILITKERRTQIEYDDWHKALSIKMIAEYKKYDINFTYGQAQKWINMTVKYLYVLCPNKIENNFSNFHVPIDNYIFNVVQKEFGIKQPKKAWSRWENHDNYINYQKSIRDNLIDISPLKWEFVFWLKEARNK